MQMQMQMLPNNKINQKLQSNLHKIKLNPANQPNLQRRKTNLRIKSNQNNLTANPTRPTKKTFKSPKRAPIELKSIKIPTINALVTMRSSKPTQSQQQQQQQRNPMQNLWSSHHRLNMRKGRNLFSKVPDLLCDWLILLLFFSIYNPINSINSINLTQSTLFLNTRTRNLRVGTGFGGSQHFHRTTQGYHCCTHVLCDHTAPFGGWTQGKPTIHWCKHD